MTTLNQRILDDAIGHHVDLTRYSNSVVRDILTLLNSADQELMTKIQSRQIDSWTKRQLDAVLVDVRRIVKRSYSEGLGLITQEMTEFAKHESEVVASGILNNKPEIPTQSLNSLFSMSAPTAEQLAAMVSTSAVVVGDGQVALLSEIFSSLAAGKEQRIRQAIRLGMVEGDTTDQIVRRLIGTKAGKYADGIIDRDRKAAEAMVRTIINHTSNMAANMTYKENSRVIKAVQWHSTLDGRTTPICQGRDGQIFPLDSGPRPPAHVRCRSFMVPVMKSYREMGINKDEIPESTRASMDGQVPASTTYGVWLKSKPLKFQESVLGVERAQLFNSGKYDIKDFINDRGQYKNLSDLKNNR